MSTRDKTELMTMEAMYVFSLGGREDREREVIENVWGTVRKGDAFFAI